MSEHSGKVAVAPHSKESEMMVLGCMLTSTNSLNIGADSLDDSDFYFTEHKLVFQTLKEAYRQDKPADVHLVCEELKRQDKLDAAGGVTYVTTLAQYAGTSAFIEQYAEIVKSKSILRRMIHAAQIVEKSALDEPKDVHGALDEAQALFFQISQAANPGAGILIAELLSGLKAHSQLPYLKELQERQEKFLNRDDSEPAITGIPTHFLDLDKTINGLGDSNLIILAARPAMGKTAFALNIAENVCFKQGLPVGIFSLEMTADQLLHRIVCSQAEVESDKIRTGALSGVEFQRIVAAASEMQDRTMVIDDHPGLKITDLRARARRMKENFDIRLLIIDYLQLISGSTRIQENRQNEISEISRMLKTLARELGVPIICLSQLSRKVEERTGHRPMMSDLRESGCLTGDTRIQNAETGTFHTIKELADRPTQTPFPVLAIDQDLKISKHTMSKAFYSGRKKTFKLTTRSGRSIKASANHPFLKLERWTPLENLAPGDHIALPRQLTIGSKGPLTKDHLAFLAHLIGDGCILPNQPYHYTNEDPENLSLVSSLAEKLFAIQPRLVKQENWHHVYLPSPFQLTKGKHHPITTWYHSLGIERARSYDKKLPATLFECSDEAIAHFLHHLWATDGNISLKKIKERLPSAAIYYSSTSETLIHQVQHLLLRLGIHGTLMTSEKKGYRKSYQVHVQGSANQIAFLKKVSSHGKRGQTGKSLLANLENIKPNPNCDIIPKQTWDLHVKPAKEQASMGWREVCSALNMSYCGSTLFKSGVSRQRMQRLAEALDDPTLHQLATSDVYWDQIVSIEELGVEDVYDATVEGAHNFVANDILVHNSIEQDSDIVMFMLRREYYDPNDKPGQAELIVAKNRHGGIGSVNLSFIKELAQFRNYTPIQIEADDESPFATF